MNTIRKLMYRPKKSDTSYLAQFYYADEQLNSIAAELDSFDGRSDPERCTALVNQLRHSQDEVLGVIEKIMGIAVPSKSRATRDYRVKFPDDVLHESLAGQLWFGAECLSAGSSIMNHEVESASMRPLARTLTHHLDTLRALLREQCLRDQNKFTNKIIDSLVEFDKLFAEFELSYVSAMVPVKTMKDYELLQDVTVLFCETVQRALKLGFLTQEMIDTYDPALMFTIPRLAIVSGLLVYPDGPLNPDMDPLNMSDMFRPFQTLLFKIRELLWTLSDAELNLLEKSLSTTNDVDKSASILAELSGLTLEDEMLAEHSAGAFCDDLSDSECAATGHNVMVHSDSTMTVIDTASSLDRSRSVGSTDNSARQLHHSKSWPEPVEAQRCLTASVDGPRASSIAFYGNQEFNFNLPVNTSIEQLQGTPSDEGIIYLSSGDPGVQQQITYVTDEFCRMFYSDVALLHDQVENEPVVADHENLQNKMAAEHVEQIMRSPLIVGHDSLTPISSSVVSGVGVPVCIAPHQMALSDTDTGKLCSSKEDFPASSSHPNAASCPELISEYESCCSTDTSSYSSGCHDDEEIALAIHAAEVSARQEARSRFKSSADLIHRLFVCISGVADQLQTNYASDLRHILKFVFECNASQTVLCLEHADSDSSSTSLPHHDSLSAENSTNASQNIPANVCLTTEPPEWIPDDQSDVCMACHAAFTFVKRRHHCRNCGKIFCAHCSSNAVPLPHYGHTKPVRVCNRCFVFHITPFTMHSSVSEPAIESQLRQVH